MAHMKTRGQEIADKMLALSDGGSVVISHPINRMAMLLKEPEGAIDSSGLLASYIADAIDMALAEVQKPAAEEKVSLYKRKSLLGT